MTTRAIRSPAPSVEETTFWAAHGEYVRHMWAPCADCVRGDCRTARLLDEAADEAARAWGRQTGGWR